MELHCKLKCVFVWCMIAAVLKVYALLPLAISGGLVAVYGGYLYKKHKLTAADAIFFAAMMLNLWYVCSSWGNVRQHDYYNFVMFADYFVSNHFFVAPPVTYLKSVFYHPPFWGVITGVFMQFLEFDAVRLVSLFAIGGAYILMWRFMERLKFREHIKWGLFSFYCFYPVHGLMSNWVNNDAMVYFLMIAAVYTAYLWYEDSSWKHTLIISGLLLLAGMIKFSGLMVVPAVGMLMLFKLCEARDKKSVALWSKFFVICMGAVLGFAWGIFLLYFRFKLLPPPIDVETQSMTAYSLVQRLFDFTGLLTPMIKFHELYQVEPNVWLTLIKTSLFGEWTWQGLIWASILYGISFVWLLLSAISFKALVLKPLGQGFALNAAVILLFFAVLIAWINFWLDYPFFCSTEFRYTAIFLPLSVLWVGHYLNQKSLPKYIQYILAGCAALMILSRFMLYLNTI